MKAGQKINMKYLIIGAGGTGGVTGYYMKKAGKDVTLIARGEHLKKIQKQGLTLEKMWDKTGGKHKHSCYRYGALCRASGRNFCLRKRLFLTGNDSVYQTLARKNTIVIPVLNIYGTVEKCRKNCRIFW